ncbi:MAG: M50 family metallopeptidase [Microcoleaceae cyanobacterium]
MKSNSKIFQSNDSDLILPDLTPYWKLTQTPTSNAIFLKAKNNSITHQLSLEEGLALRYFSGKFTIAQIQRVCDQQFNHLSNDFVFNLLQRLIELKILAWEDEEFPSSSPLKQENEKQENSLAIKQDKPVFLQLKDCVHWIEHPQGYWILRNPEDIKFLQVGQQDKTIIDQLQYQSASVVATEFCVSQTHIKRLLQQLTVTAMLEGTTPPKPPKRKFNPMQLLFFRIPLFNPDKWLSQHIDKLRWIWTQPVAFILIIFLVTSAIIGYSQKDEILYTGVQLLSNAGGSLLLPFGLLAMFVVTIHELGHAFTLKKYGGIVPEIGLLIMMLMPAAYTNTTDSYCLVKRRQRVLVIAAGVIVQFIIAALALLLWNWSNPSSWLHMTSYLLMTAALFTVALNLNPLARFDGYYLASAITGINNLRSRSFKLYQKLFTGKPNLENKQDTLILACYAPFSLAYIYFVFGFLLLRITDWSFTNIPTLSLILLLIWGIYSILPEPKS